jgi:hypothetical protein
MAMIHAVAVAPNAPWRVARVNRELLKEGDKHFLLNTLRVFKDERNAYLTF